MTYRLLSVAFDPLNEDAEAQLTGKILAISQRFVKGIVQIESMMREATVRIRNLKRKRKNGTEPGMMKVFMSVFFNKLDIDTKRSWQDRGGREDFKKLMGSIKKFRALDKSMTSTRMDVSAFGTRCGTRCARHGHNSEMSPKLRCGVRGLCNKRPCTTVIGNALKTLCLAKALFMANQSKRRVQA